MGKNTKRKRQRREKRRKDRKSREFNERAGPIIQGQPNPQHDMIMADIRKRWQRYTPKKVNT